MANSSCVLSIKIHSHVQSADAVRRRISWRLRITSVPPLSGVPSSSKGEICDVLQYYKLHVAVYVVAPGVSGFFSRLTIESRRRSITGERESLEKLWRSECSVMWRRSCCGLFVEAKSLTALVKEFSGFLWRTEHFLIFKTTTKFAIYCKSHGSEVTCITGAKMATYQVYKYEMRNSDNRWRTGAVCAIKI